MLKQQTKKKRKQNKILFRITFLLKYINLPIFQWAFLFRLQNDVVEISKVQLRKCFTWLNELKPVSDLPACKLRSYSSKVKRSKVKTHHYQKLQHVWISCSNKIKK